MVYSKVVGATAKVDVRDWNGRGRGGGEAAENSECVSVGKAGGGERVVNDDVGRSPY